jgi:hypothetical protein
VAIIVNDWSHIELSYVVPFYSDGSDISPLVDLLRHYATYPAELMNATMFILVDDGSPSKVEIPADIDLNIRVLRVDEDIAWNQPGARNLGATMSVSDQIIMSFAGSSFAHSFVIARDTSLGRAKLASSNLAIRHLDDLNALV